MSVNTNDEAVKVQWRLKEWFPDLDPKTHVQLQSFFDLVVKHNRTLNLLSPKTIPVADAIHFSDCIIASQLIFDDAASMKSIYDFGSGNGFPGIVFGILYPGIEVVLIDSDPRKVEILGQMSAALSLRNVNAKAASVESLAADSVQFAMARGLANISKSILMARKPIVKGGALYHLKGDQWGMEITDIPTQLCSVWYPGLVGEYVLPSTQIKFGVVKTTKL